MRTLLALAAVVFPTAAMAAPHPIAGRWITVNGKALVEIAPCGAQLCGHIVQVLKVEPAKAKTDVNNPDAALRRRPIIGLPILTGFIPNGDRWAGRIYDPESGKTYRSEAERHGHGLTVKGCIGPFCKTQHWTLAR